MLVIVHGWSDSADSFDFLAGLLRKANPALSVATIRLADYVSMDDEVTYADLRNAMNTAWKSTGLPTAPRSVDVIVHSTGALVVRDWMTAFFQPATNPIKRLVMLAPANFGSPLATTGQSFLGRVVKGFKLNEPFQTGTHILKGLELASPYSWNLALKDRFDPANVWYGPNRVLCTVLVGTIGYSGIRAIANSAGSDGTVRVSTANLNPILIRADFSTDPQNPVYESIAHVGRTAFLRLAGENHGTIAQGGTNPDTLPRILDALATDDATFEDYCDALQAASGTLEVSQDLDKNTQGYQNTVIHLIDNQAQPVTDYLIEAYVPSGDTAPTADDVDDELTKTVQEDVLVDAHVYSDDKSYRALLFNCTRLKGLLTSVGKNLEISVTALPQVKAKSAGYKTFGYDDVGGILLTPAQQNAMFGADRTILIQITIRREQSPDLFVFRAPK
ncbi:alpha/beta hydrolase [Pseudolysobacter antarcticus]|uniref:Alpha/beta hydrolase n=1 Tax=Pseudolysobacter antarcticus TaxID=2511995 RepID=A0A411HG33_9GAMM|nr:alpha/beta hydrolase [Pseudolysobacter antarcticus]QBB69455.1 alpha/beta hydrolase [Pseudolysobacter antarcticus]